MSLPSLNWKNAARASAAGHRADFERERSDALMTEALMLAKVALSAREKATRLEGELSAAFRRRWWRWLSAQSSQPASVVAGVDLPGRS